MKNITTTILLVLVSLLSYSQEYYRDTTIERAVFNEVNKHRDSLGIPKVRYNVDNTKAISFGESLVLEDLEDGQGLYHCGCTPGVEIIALVVIGDTSEINLTETEIAQRMVNAWNRSPSHKEGMEDTYMTRGFNSVYIFKSTRKGGKYVALSVYQFLRDKNYYVNLGWSEDERFSTVSF